MLTVYQSFDTSFVSLLEPVWKDLDNRRNAKGGMVFDIEDFNTLTDVSKAVVGLVICM